jgi:GT2 family glycosyltransferase
MTTSQEGTLHSEIRNPESETCLSVIVVNWNTHDLLAQCLESVYAHPPSDEFEVFVVDNASADGSAQMVRERFPSVRLIKNHENVGFARANNQAIRESRGRYLLLLNSDTSVQPGVLYSMVRFLEEHPQAGAVGPKLLNPDGSFQASCADFPTLLSELLLITGLAHLIVGPYAPSPRPLPHEAARPVDWVAGAALLIRRSAIDQIGLLDEGYFLYSEETDWCWRLWQGGWEVWYLPNVAITHCAGASTRKRSATSYEQLYSSKVRFFANAYGPRAAWRLQTMLIVTGCFRLVLWALLSVIRLPVDGGRPMHTRFQQEIALLKKGFKWSAHEAS